MPTGELLQPATFPVFVFDLSSLSDRAMIRSSLVFFLDYAYTHFVIPHKNEASHHWLL
jgi:hypothetical protein